jgi:hypothetical protein
MKLAEIAQVSGKFVVNMPDGTQVTGGGDGKAFGTNFTTAQAHASAVNAEIIAALSASPARKERKPIEGVDTKLDGSRLTLVVDLAGNLGTSASGKSITVATTRGNVPFAEYRRPDGKTVYVSLNAYAK